MNSDQLINADDNKVVTDGEWLAIKKEWVTTAISLKNLAKRHKISYKRILKAYKKGQWSKSAGEFRGVPDDKRNKKYSRRLIGNEPEPIVDKVSPVDLSDLCLTIKAYKYVLIYTSNGFDAKDAVIKAGYGATEDPNIFKTVVHRVQNNPKVKEAVRRIIAVQLEPYRTVGMAKIFDQLWKRCFYDIDIFYDENGELKPLKDVPEEWRCIVDGIDRKFFGKDALVEVKTYQLPNRDMNIKFLYSILTGGDLDGDNSKIPSEARERAKNILNKAREEFSTIKMSTTTLTIERDNGKKDNNT